MKEISAMTLSIPFLPIKEPENRTTTNCVWLVWERESLNEDGEEWGRQWGFYILEEKEPPIQLALGHFRVKYFSFFMWDSFFVLVVAWVKGWWK